MLYVCQLWNRNAYLKRNRFRPDVLKTFQAAAWSFSHQILYLLVNLLLIEKLLSHAVRQAVCSVNLQAKLISPVLLHTHKNLPISVWGQKKRAGPLHSVGVVGWKRRRSESSSSKDSFCHLQEQWMAMIEKPGSTNGPCTWKSWCRAKYSEIHAGTNWDCHTKMYGMVLTWFHMLLNVVKNPSLSLFSLTLFLKKINSTLNS